MNSLQSTNSNKSCPSGLFQCTLSNKYNHLFSAFDDEESKPQFICIDMIRVCDGKRDCPNEEDELNCKYHNNQPRGLLFVSNFLTYFFISGCYLCRNSTEHCISMSKLCDHYPDCPNGDDEINCKSIGITNYESKFESDQYGPVNINIVNKDSGNIFKSPNFKNQYPKNESDIGENNMNRWIKNDKEDNDKKQYEDQNSLPLVQDGVGFQFRVNNFVIYNSQVKMFDQDSDNVGINREGSETNKQHYLQTQKNQKLRNDAKYKMDNKMPQFNVR